MAFIDDLRKQFQGFLSGAGHVVNDVGQGVVNTANQFNNATQPIFNAINQAPQQAIRVAAPVVQQGIRNIQASKPSDYFYPTQALRGNLGGMTQQGIGNTLQGASFGLYNPNIPKPVGTIQNLAAAGGQIAGSIPSFSLGAGLIGKAFGATPAVSGALNATRFGKFAQPAAEVLGGGALSNFATTPGNISTRLQATGQQFSPTNLAMAAPFIALGGLQAAKAIKMTPEVQGRARAVLDGLQNFDSFANRPTAQMAIIDNATKVLNQIRPDLAKSRELTKLTTQNPAQWRQFVTQIIGDHLYQAQNPEINVGLSARELKSEKLPVKSIEANTQNTIGTQAEAQLGNKLSPPVDLTTKEGKLSTQLPPTPTLGDNGLPGVPNSPSSPNSVTDPVQKIIQALKEAKPIRGEQQALYSQAMSQRTAKVAAMGAKVPGEQGFFAQLGQLKGQLPKAQFEGIRGQLQQSDIDHLFNQIESSNLSPLEKVSAKSSLADLLGKEGGQVPTKSGLSLLNEVFPPEFTQAIMDKRSGWQKMLSTAGDILSVPRSLMASFDLSAPLRQGVFIAPSHPKEWASAFGSMFKYFGSEKAYQGMLQDITARPTYQTMRQSGLAITGKATPILNQREEAFMSNLAEKIPGVGGIVRASDRAYTGFLNKLRADTFDSLLNDAKTQGVANPATIDSIAKFVNTATGRGDLGALNRAGGVLSTALFSPRLLASRLNILNPMYYVNLQPFARKEALKSLLGFAGTAGTVLGLAKIGGASVEADPRNADFGKIKVGNTRYDILGGFQQPIRVASQLITGKLISSTTGKEYTLGEGYKPLTRKDIALRFFESKESPVVSFISGLLEGTNSIGQPFNLPTEIVNRFIPMVAQDMYDLAKDRNSPLAMLAGTPGIFGVGVQTYGKQIPNIQTTPAGKVSVKLSPLPGLAEDIASKITGTPQSNVPQDQQQALVNSKTNDLQNKVLVDKVKQQLQSGKNPNSGVQQTTYNIDGVPQTGYKVGNNFLYIDENGDTQSKTIKQVEKGQTTYKQSLLDAQMTQLKNNGDIQGWLTNADQLGQSYMTQLQNPNIKPLEKVQLENKLTALAKEIDRYKSYGGFAKPKSPPKSLLRVKRIATPAAKKSRALKIKSSSFKPISIRKPSAQLMSGVVR